MKPIYILVSLFLFSCASRQVQVDKIDIKKDSIVETKSLVKTVETKEKMDSTNINTTTDNCEITITPIDSCKEIIVDGKSYKNVVLTIKKNKTNTLYINNKKESSIIQKDSIGMTNTKTSQRIVGKTKHIDKKANYWLFFWLFILIIILYLLWRNRRLLL
jgi:hypothetical protein